MHDDVGSEDDYAVHTWYLHSFERVVWLAFEITVGTANMLDDADSFGYAACIGALS
jgi:hypothetical protein